MTFWISYGGQEQTAQSIIQAMKSSHSNRKSGVDAPHSAAEISRLMGTLVPEPMSPWQVHGFVAGLICGLGSAPEAAFAPEEDPEGFLMLDSLDELSRKIEEADCPIAPEAIAAHASGPSIAKKLIAAVAETEYSLAQNNGEPELAFAEAAITSQNPAQADVPSARAYARGLLRGLVMSIEAEEELSAEKYGEALSLLFILTEDDLGADFGSATEVAEARQAVTAALPGLVAQLWNISHSETDED